MEQLIPVLIEFFKSNPYFSIFAAVVAAASAVSALTPTPKKGTVLSKIYFLLDLLALNVGKAKDKG